MMEQKKDTVDLQHADYAATATQRADYDDVISGTRALRAKHSTYYPQFPLEHKEDYAARHAASTLLNVTKKTRDTLCGLVFQKPITFSEEVPTAIVDLCENIDNKGNHLDIFARRVFEASFEGWAVILTDAPTATASDLGQQKALGLRPYCVAYKACDVINWDYQVNSVSRRTELSLIVLRERASVAKGMFLREVATRYRVFYLKDARVYWQLWEEQKNDKGEIVCIQIGTDTLIASQTQIPVAVVGKLGDAPPLMDLADKNIEHAQTYSDYKSIIHKTCVPVPFTTGVSAEEAGKAIAGSTMWHLPEGGSIGFAEVQGSSIDKTRQALEDVKTDMSWLGLQMLMPSPNKATTATEILIDTIQDTSELQVKAMQLKDAMELTFGFMARYLKLGDDAGGEITLGAMWSQMVLTEQKIQTLNTMVSDGNYPLEFMLMKLEEAGELPEGKTAEEAMEAIEKEVSEIKPVQNALQMPNEVIDETQTEPPATETNGQAKGQGFPVAERDRESGEARG